MSDVDKIVEFIEQRLTEDEQWALAASSPSSWRGNYPPIPTGVRWTWAVGDNWEPYQPNPLEEYIGEAAEDTAPTLVTVDEWPYDNPMGRWTHFQHRVLARDEEVRTADGAHIVRHDPARVLRDVAAARRIIGDDNSGAALYAVHERGHWPEELTRWADEVLRSLAHAWSEHPDFDAAWSVR